MKQLVSVTILGACLLAIAAVASAQDCSTLTNYALRGSYTMSGSGWVDLSKLLAGVPGLPPLPTGFAPVSWVGAFTFNGTGGGTGWAYHNSGGFQMSGPLVGLKYAINNADCSIHASFSVKSNELPGVTAGPFSLLMVPVLKQDGMWWGAPALELHMTTGGAAPGAPPAGLVQSGVAYRISMQE
jgi:hypothetical protein